MHGLLGYTRKSRQIAFDSDHDLGSLQVELAEPGIHLTQWPAYTLQT